MGWDVEGYRLWCQLGQMYSEHPINGSKLCRAFPIFNLHCPLDMQKKMYCIYFNNKHSGHFSQATTFSLARTKAQSITRPILVWSNNLKGHFRQTCPDSLDKNSWIL